MDHKVVNSFIKAALQVLESELAGSVGLGQPSAQGTHYVTQDVTALVGVTGHLRGMVIFGLSESTGLALVSQMMGQPFQRMDEMAQSGIAELGNVVVGSTVTSLAESGYRCVITPPAVLLGRDSIISIPSLKRIVVPLATPLGVIEMQLALRANGVV